MNPQLEIMLQQAIQAFQGGNFDGADLILKKVLQIDSKNLPALNVLGLIKASQSNYREAAEYLVKAARICPNDASIQYNLAKCLSDSGNNKEALAHHKKAVALAPNNPEAWLNHGKTASHLGHHEDALICYGKALSLRPDYVEALVNKGVTLRELKRYQEAIDFSERALVINPNLAEPWSNKGATLHELKRFDEAITHYEKVISLKPDYYEAWSNKGATLHELKRFDEAITHYDRAISLKPDYHEAWSNKGMTLHELKRFDEAITHYDRAISLKPDYHEAWSNKGATLHELKLFDEAITHYDRAISLKPDYHKAWSNKGVALKELKSFDEAITHYDRAISLRPDYDEAWINKAVLNLYLKKYNAGWENYDWRLNAKDSQLKMAIEGLVLWDGSNCRHLLIFSEQGIGDVIFYASMLQIAKNRVRDITIAIDLRLLPILTRSFPGVKFVDINLPLENSLYDAQIPFGSLPVVLNMNPDMVGRKVPYLLDNDVLTTALKNVRCSKKPLKCGVAWKSNNQKLGRDKSILLSDLNPIFQVDGYEFINLQYGSTPEEIIELEKSYGVKLTCIEDIDLFKNIDGLLSIIQTCDFIVTTSNVTAHLAGALGKATFLLVPYSAGRIWYWHEEVTSSWYPSISLYSQSQNFEWSSAITAIGARLKNEIF